MRVKRVFGIAVLVLAAALSRGAAAEEQTPQSVTGKQTPLNRCWTPQALAGSAQELKSVRSHAKLDLAALKQEALAPLSPLPQELRGSIRSVELPAGEKLIALTFDLC